MGASVGASVALGASVGTAVGAVVATAGDTASGQSREVAAGPHAASNNEKTIAIGIAILNIFLYMVFDSPIYN